MATPGPNFPDSLASAALPGFPFSLVNLEEQGDHFLFPARAQSLLVLRCLLLIQFLVDSVQSHWSIVGQNCQSNLRMLGKPLAPLRPWSLHP